MKYLVEVEKGEPGQVAFGGSIAQVPGCFAVGETLDELRANLVESLAALREVALENGMAAPEPPSGFILQIEVPA